MSDTDDTKRLWSEPAEAAAETFDVDPERGLGDDEARRRLDEHGPNRLREAERRSAWSILWEQLRSVIVLMLGAAIAISAAFGQWVEALAIFVVVVINTVIGFVMELRAARSMEALRELGQAEATVRRDGEERTVDADELVPGDVLVLEPGQVIGADVRWLEVDGLQVDESPLTGESTPVSKGVDPVEAEADAADRASMGFKGTAVTRGRGVGVVVATGQDTEVGGIAEMVETAGEARTPLERRLDGLATRLVWLTLGVGLAVTVAGLLAGRDVLLMVQTGIALAVAAVPEGLVIVATVALARGVHRMADRDVLVRRLSSVETLGSTTVICSDKTGTLTENRMHVAAFELPNGRVDVHPGEDGDVRFERDGETVALDDDDLLARVVHVGVLANERDEDEGDGEAADPMDRALLDLGQASGRTWRDLAEATPRVRFEPFDHETKMVASFHEEDDGVLVAIKGAPEAVFAASQRIASTDGETDLGDDDRDDWHERAERMAAEGLRVLGLAYRREDAEDGEPYEDLVLLGVVGLLDPPRSGVAEAIAECRDAGIRVVMVTGDHPETARHIAAEIGIGEADELRVVTGDDLEESGERRDELMDADVFARVDPRQKLDLIDGYQARDEVLAMTGDGVNDAPALKKADIGVAMGQRGTDVAREAADMVLLDDAFGSIVVAVRLGRVIFRNVRAFVVYLLSGNVGQVLAVGAAAIVDAPLPLLPLQILYLNIVNDVFPALALGLGSGERHVMESPPRKAKEAILTPKHWWAIGLYGGVLGAAVLGAFFYSLHGLGLSSEEAVTSAFLAVSLGRLLHVFNMRDVRSGVISNEVTRNPYVWGALAVVVALLAAALYVAPLADLLSLVPPQGRQWWVIGVASLVPLVVGQVALLVLQRRRDHHGAGEATSGES